MNWQPCAEHGPGRGEEARSDRPRASLPGDRTDRQVLQSHLCTKP